MRNIKLIICYYLLLMIALPSSTKAQSLDSTWTGTVSGVVKDSAYKYILQFASVAIYYAKDTSLINYQLSDISGGFHFKELPYETPLVIRVFYTGYRTFAIGLIISPKTKNVLLPEVNLIRDVNELQEVVVRATPPVRMNGDTLEFSANAFRLDKNAVAQDLLKRLPGVTVWADGSITVNGKQVSQVLVDGRPFFGNDPRVAIQNIGKSAIDKVQVYQRNPDMNNPLDSTTNINIKLKKDKNYGYFGKTSIGTGTTERYEVDGNINFFKPRTQLGIVGTSNNVNKVAPDPSTLLKSSTYKGSGATIEYQTDFSLQGTNQTSSTGIVFQHDFLPNVDPIKKELFSGNYFNNNNDNNTVKKLLTIIPLVKDSLQFLNSYTNLTSSNISHRLDITYDKTRSNSQLEIKADAESLSNRSNSYEQTSLADRLLNLQSTSNAVLSSLSNSNKLILDGRYVKRKNPFSLTRLPGDFEISYSIDYGSITKDQTGKTEFKSNHDPSQNKIFDRSSHFSGDDSKHRLLFSMGNLSKWIFGYRSRLLSGLEIKLQNYLEITTHSEINRVGDLDSLTNNYIQNKNLTADSRYSIVNENPNLNLSKNITRTFNARYQKALLFNLRIQEQLYKLSNISTLSIQNISYNHSKFIPNAEISYSNYQYGEYQDIFNFKFGINANYPTVNQLTPLVDSLNLYHIQRGNITLQPSDQKEFSFDWHHTSFQKKNTFYYAIGLKVGIINKNLSDSSITDSLGRTSFYTVNADGRQYLRFSGNLNKALKFGKHNQIQITLSPSLGFERVPNNINGLWNISNSVNIQNTLNVLYTSGDFLAANFKQVFYHYSSQQQIFPNRMFQNNLQITSLSMSCNLSRKLNVASNINFNSNSLTEQKENKFTIWNFNTGYRFLSDNSLELKLDVLDILHQNTGIINYGSGNTITNGSANVLQQYFMITLTYFLRKFGKGKN